MGSVFAVPTDPAVSQPTDDAAPAGTTGRQEAEGPTDAGTGAETRSDDAPDERSQDHQDATAVIDAARAAAADGDAAGTIRALRGLPEQLLVDDRETFTSVAALVATGVPFILGFARSRPIRDRLAALSDQQRRWLHAGGAVRLGA